MLQCVAVCCSVRQCVLQCVLQCVAVGGNTKVLCLQIADMCCSVVLCVAFCSTVCCSGSKHQTACLEIAASPLALVCCSVLQCVAVYCIVSSPLASMCCSVLQSVAVCCRVLQCVAVCCKVLQCVAVRVTALCSHYAHRMIKSVKHSVPLAHLLCSPREKLRFSKLKNDIHQIEKLRFLGFSQCKHKRRMDLI